MWSKAFWIVILILLIGAGFYFLNTFYPGTLVIDWLGYNIVATVPAAIIFTITCFIIILFILKLIRIIMSLPNLLTNYQEKKAKQKSCDQLWIAYQSIKLGSQPFPQKILDQLLTDHYIDSRIVLDLIIDQKIIEGADIQVYLDQLKQLPFTELTLSAISYQTAIDNALVAGKFDVARTGFQQLQSHFPQHPLISIYQSKLQTYSLI